MVMLSGLKEKEASELVTKQLKDLKMWNIPPDVLFNDAHDCDIEKHKAFLISPETYDKHIFPLG